jgi:hypothetical protein
LLQCPQYRSLKPCQQAKPDCRGLALRQLEVADQHLCSLLLAAATDAVPGLDRLDPKLRKGLPHARRVVQTQDELALDSPQEARQAPEILLAEQPLPAVLFAVPIRRVDIEQRAWLVIALDDLVVGLVLDKHPRQAQVPQEARLRLSAKSSQRRCAPSVK